MEIIKLFSVNAEFSNLVVHSVRSFRIILFFIVHGYFVYSKSMWIGLWKCQFFKYILLVLLEWENEK